MSGLWSKIAALFRGGNSSNREKSGSKKKSEADENGVPDQYKVKKAPRSYDEIDLPEDREEKGAYDYKVEKKPRSYEEVVLPEDSRLSQNKQPVLNYVEVDFKNPPKKKKKKSKHPVPKSDEQTHYADITVKQNSVIVN